jgi:hypothetical protein
LTQEVNTDMKTRTDKHEHRTSVSLDGAMPIWWVGGQLTAPGQRPDLLTEFYRRWDHWRANGLTVAERDDFWAWLKSHAKVDFQAMTVQAYEPFV